MDDAYRRATEETGTRGRLKKHRIQLDLSPAAVQEIDSLGQVIGVTSRTQVIRFALSLLDASCHEQEKAGEPIRLVNSSKFV